MEHKQIEFKGLKVKFDKIDMPKDNSPDCCNVDISTRGAMKNINGIEKQITSGLTTAIMALHQLDCTDFVVTGEYLYKL